MKIGLEEARKVEDIQLQQIREKSQECGRLEEEVVSLRKKLEKAQTDLTMNIQQLKGVEQLDMILNAKISPLVKVSIGYEEESRNSKEEDKKAITFVEAVIKENDNSHQSEIISAIRLLE